MSNMLGFQPGSSKAPSEGVGPAHSAEEDRRMDADVASEGSEEGEIQDDQTVDPKQDSEIKDDQPVGTKRKRSPSIEEQRPSKRTDVHGISFQSMQNPPKRIPCMIRINEREPFGSLYRATDGFAILLFLDAGLYGPPTVSLAFRNSGTETGKDKARNSWDTESNVRGQRAMSDIVHGYAGPEGTEARMSNKTVLDACHDQDTGNLMYMRFKSWPQVLGFRENDAFKGVSGVVKRSMDTIFQPKNSYLVELWFIAPFKASDFRRRCLRIIAASLAVKSLDLFRDDDGVYFNDLQFFDPPTLLGGLIAPPAQDQQASASDFSFGLEFPQFIPSGISGPEASYVLDSLLGLLDIEEDNSEPEPEFDSDVGSSGDRENEDERP